MRIVGCLMGGAAGFAIGGPVGLIIGTAAGGAASGLMTVQKTARGKNGVLGYSTEIARLGTALILSDGPMRSEEMRAFRQIFPVPLTRSGEFSQMMRGTIPTDRNEALEGVAHLLDQYRDYYDTMNIGPQRSFGSKLAASLGMGSERPVSPAEIECERLVADFLHIAASDGPMTVEEVDFCRDLAFVLGLEVASFDRLLSEMGAGAHVGPWALLGIARSANLDEVRAAWKARGRTVHPDAVSEASPAIQRLAQRKMAALNEAYESIRTGEALKSIGFIARLSGLFGGSAPQKSLRNRSRTLRLSQGHEEQRAA